jgi:hypothetical protein
MEWWMEVGIVQRSDYERRLLTPFTQWVCFATSGGFILLEVRVGQMRKSILP